MLFLAMRTATHYALSFHSMLSFDKIFKKEGLNGILSVEYYWVPHKLPQIYTVIVYICIRKVA